MLDEALEESVSGCILVLDRGEYSFGRSRRQFPADILILGEDRVETTLTTHSLMAAQRLRIERLTINCDDDYLTDFRSGGSMQIVNCKLFNYNSGAGGSSCINASDSIFLIRESVLEGMSGRQQDRRGSFGHAFDLRRDNLLYLDRVEFIDNDMSSISAYAVIDRCKRAVGEKINGSSRNSGEGGFDF